MKINELIARCSMPMMLLRGIEFKHSIVRKANMLEQLVLTLLSESDNSRLISNCLAEYGINENLYSLIAHFIFELKNSGVLEIETDGNSEEEIAGALHKMPLKNLSLTADGLRLYRDDFLPTNEKSRPQCVTIGYDIVNDVFHQRMPMYKLPKKESFLLPSFDKIDIYELRQKVTTYLESYDYKRSINLHENENVIDVNIPDPIDALRQTSFNIRIMEEGYKLVFKTDAEFKYFIEHYPIEAKKEIFLNAMNLNSELMDVEYPRLNFSDVASATAIHTYNDLQSLGQRECIYYVAKGSDWNRKEFFKNKKTVSQDRAYNILHRLSKYCDAAFFSEDKCVFFETVKLSIPHVGVTNFSLDGIFHIERTATEEQLAELQKSFPELELSPGRKNGQKTFDTSGKDSSNSGKAPVQPTAAQAPKTTHDNNRQEKNSSNTTSPNKAPKPQNNQENTQKQSKFREPDRFQKQRETYKTDKPFQHNGQKQDMPLYKSFNAKRLKSVAETNQGLAVKQCCMAAHQILSELLQIDENISLSRIVYKASAQKIIDQNTNNELLMLCEANGLLNKEGFVPRKLKRVTAPNILTWIGIVESLITKLNNTK